MATAFAMSGPPLSSELASSHARAMRSDFRTMLRIAMEAGLLVPYETDLRCVLADDEVLRVITGELRVLR